jgi:hypothetical protein
MDDGLAAEWIPPATADRDYTLVWACRSLKPHHWRGRMAGFLAGGTVRWFDPARCRAVP